MLPHFTHMQIYLSCRPSPSRWKAALGQSVCSKLSSLKLCQFIPSIRMLVSPRPVSYRTPGSRCSFSMHFYYYLWIEYFFLCLRTTSISLFCSFFLFGCGYYWFSKIHEICLEKVQPLLIQREWLVWHWCNLAAKKSELECACMNNDNLTVLVSEGGRCHWVSMCTVWPSHSKWLSE